jgi:Dolichyl-phosphate-mannose-protein mannosyltransferase
VAAERTLTRRASWAERVEPLTRNPGRTAAIAFGGMLLVSVAVRLWLSRKIASPWIMIDELLYSEMAKSFATSGHFLVRDAPTSLNNVVYPALISPAWLAHPMGTTYGLAKAINVVVMTSTAIPLYLWARRLVSPVLALLTVALTLLMPSFVYTGMLMTENAFLPAFVLAAFAVALVLERPTLLRQLAAFAAIVLAIAIRYQGLVLLLVLPAAILLKVVFELRVERRPQASRFLWNELRRYWISFALLVGGALLYAGLQVARGHTLRGALGSYQVIAGHGYDFGEVRHWVLLHFAELGLSVAMLPAMAFLVLLGLAFVRGGTRSEAERAFMAVTTAAVPLIVVEVAVFASRFSLRIEERYMFFLAPLLFLAFALWIDRGLPRPPVLTAVAAVVPAALLFALPLATLLNVSILSDTFGFIPLLRLSSKVSGGIREVRHLMLVGGIGAAILFALWPRHAFPRIVFPSAVAAFLVLSTYPVVTMLHNYSQALRNTAGTLGSPSWVDGRIGTGGNVSFLLGTTSESWPETLSLWQNEFWNRSLGPVDNLGTPEPAGGPETPVQVSPVTGEIVSKLTGQPVRARFVVSSLSYGLDGQLVGARPPFALYRTDGPLRVAEARSGVYGDGWAGADATYTRYVADKPGRVLVTLSRDLWRGPDVPGHAQVQLVPLNGPRASHALVTRRWTLHSGGQHAFTLPAPARPFVVTVHVSPTFSPSQFGQADTRQLGAQVRFTYDRLPP